MLNMVLQIYNPSTWETEVEDQMSSASLSYIADSTLALATCTLILN